MPSESQRLAAPMAQGTLLWRDLYRKWVTGWLRTAERTMEAHKADDEVWDWDQHTPITKSEWDALVEWLTACYEAGRFDAADLVGLGQALGREWAREWAGNLVGMRWDEGLGGFVEQANAWAVPDTLRDMVHERTLYALDEGMGYAELKASIMDEFVTDLSPIGGEARSLMVARTEAVRGYDLGACANYQAVGIEWIQVAHAGEPLCDECEAWDGTEMTIEDYMADPILHPNCSAYPVPLPFKEE